MNNSEITPTLSVGSSAAGSAAHVPVVSPASVGSAATTTTVQTAPVVSATGVCKVYEIGGQRQVILDHVDFRADAGECVFLVGPSGSGKTTLLSILGCLLGSDGGEISIDGRRIDQLNKAGLGRVRRETIGFVFQRFQLLNSLSARDNVAFPLTLQGASMEVARERADELLDRVGLLSHRQSLPRSMSPGQCQRVAMARALITRPKVILADEPTAALDEKSGQDAMKLMRELIAEAGSTTIVVTHDPRVYSFADRICEIVGGKIP